MSATGSEQHPYYRALTPLLDTHADQLAGSIDASEPIAQAKGRGPA